MRRGSVQQKQIEAFRQLMTPEMNNDQLNNFVGSLASVDAGTLRCHDATAAQIGDRYKYWIDPVHKEDEGNDWLGPRPQCGIVMLEADLYALPFKGGTAFARRRQQDQARP